MLRFVRPSLLSALLVLGGAAASRVTAQTPPCDPALRPVDRNRFAYSPRGDRCEGLYVNDVGGTTLTIMSLTAAFEDYDPTADPSLYLTWSSPAGDSLRIQVRAVQPRLFFGMDAERPLAAKAYEWPTAILSPLNILQADIGLLAWTRVKRDARSLTVHVPLKVTRSKAVAPTTGYSLVLYPVKELKEVYVTLGPADAAGRPVAGALINDHEAQKQGYYPAERPIRLSLPALRPPGLYYLEVTATLLNGNPVKADPMLIDASGQ